MIMTLGRKIEAAKQELSNPSLTPAERSRIAGDLKRMEKEKRDKPPFKPRGRGFISQAAPTIGVLPDADVVAPPPVVVEPATGDPVPCIPEDLFSEDLDEWASDIVEHWQEHDNGIWAVTTEEARKRVPTIEHILAANVIISAIGFWTLGEDGKRWGPMSRRQERLLPEWCELVDTLEKVKCSHE